MITGNNCHRDNVLERRNTMRKGLSGEREKGVLCPNIKKPFNDCYCTSTSSLHAEATIYYCGGGYKDCEIYLKNAGEEGEKI